MAQTSQNQKDKEFQVRSKLVKDVIENGLKRKLSPLEIKLAEIINGVKNSIYTLADKLRLNNKPTDDTDSRQTRG